ncbi:MAG: glutamate synthase [Deltaproteobacteria bacterium]|nr:glutamate synthase [Deltaproteobacteria bacterium]
MAELRPYPFSRLVSRIFRELDERGSIFDLPQKRFVRGRAGLDTSVAFHHQLASSPLGPAAGPQSQLAQNIVLAFLGGGRVFELKTVQILDELEVPRPCIDMQTIGYNVEWSQELKLEESLEEYVKASMLLDMLVASGKLELAPGFEHVIFDMSVGYDLAGIQSERVRAFMCGMKDASDVVARLRSQIPAEYAEYRDLDFRTELSDTLTLSTFHGCPPDEIERIVDFLLREQRLNCVVKLNPTLLGAERARGLLNDLLGYPDQIPDSAFAGDATWQQAVDFTGRLAETAASLELGLGVKFTNTLIVENEREFFPASEQQMYLSGPPLHVLAMNLVRRFRDVFGDAHPISFSAGIDQANFADAVSLGLVPVTVCSDLLKPGGYARMERYFKSLWSRMEALSAPDVEHFILSAHGHAEAALAKVDGLDDATRAACLEALAEGDARAIADEAWESWVSQAKLMNTASYVEALESDARYGRAANAKLPRKVGSTLVLFDCLTCDKCVPVCPNDANFTLKLPDAEIPSARLLPDGAGGFRRVEGAAITLKKKHQLANFADFCNECGNCDVFCPEDGGPYVLKPRFFGSLEDFEEYRDHDGFFLERTPKGDAVHGRFDGLVHLLEVGAEDARYSGEGFALTLAPESFEVRDAKIEHEVDLTFLYIMDALRRAVLDGDVNYVNA